MQVRDWLNNNSAVVTILAVVMLVISLGVIIMNSTGGNRQITEMYYYNTQTGTIFIAGSGELAPIETEAGPDTGVRVYLYGCGECPSGLAGLTLEEVRAQNVLVGYFEKFSPQAKAALTSESTDPEAQMRSFEAMEMGQLFQIPGNDQWMPSNTMQGMQMRDQMITRMQCPEGESPKMCFPE